MFGRKFRVQKIVPKLLDVAVMLYRSSMFQNSWQIMQVYLTGNNRSIRQVITKDNLTINISENPLDITTLLVIFCRREYGYLKPDSVVIDIGANIGMFSLYAAKSGARKVYAFEPNLEAYTTLCKNIRDNSLSDIIVPFQLAVSNTDNDWVYIPKHSSPLNRTNVSVKEKDLDQFDKVKTISWSSIVAQNNLDQIELLKMDCEGAEYDILFSIADSEYQRIKSIRLEHHNSGRKAELIAFLRKRSFTKIFDRNIIMWFESHV